MWALNVNGLSRFFSLGGEFKKKGEIQGVSWTQQYTGFMIQSTGSKHVITRNFSRDFIHLIIIL